jgi:glycosyltransferase involved in cell wall biosynthesis
MRRGARVPSDSLTGFRKAGVRLKVLIDSSNLDVGGGTQVASAFIETVDRALASTPEDLPSWVADTDWYVSESVRDALGPLQVIRPKPTARRWRLQTLQSPPYDAIFTVFGPAYRIRRAPIEVMGYADVTSVYPRLAHLEPVSLKGGIRSAISRMSARDVDRLVVETDAMKALVVDRGVAPGRVTVVPNTVHPAMAQDPDPELVSAFIALRAPDAYVFSYVTRAWRHKNLGMVGPILDELSRAGVQAQAFVTLREDEWAALPEASRTRLINVGSSSPTAVRALYAASDAVLFCSLREAFSATPLEALQVGLPLFASDRDFVRSVCGDAATYIDPLDAKAAARTIAAALAQPAVIENRVARGRAMLATWPSAADRSQRFLDVITEAIGARA